MRYLIDDFLILKKKLTEEIYTFQETIRFLNTKHLIRLMIIHNSSTPQRTSIDINYSKKKILHCTPSLHTKEKCITTNILLSVVGRNNLNNNH